MAEVEVLCAVYGERTVFPIKIARDARVSALQEKIVRAKKEVTDRFKVYPATLTLYLARKKEGEETKWLKDDDDLDDYLRGGISTEYEEMRPSWKLTKAELLGPDFTPGRKEIHVLVELPSVGLPALARDRQLVVAGVHLLVEKGGTYLFGDPTLGSRIYIRLLPALFEHCWGEIHDEKENTPHLVLLGTPGIGKRSSAM